MELSSVFLSSAILILFSAYNFLACFKFCGRKKLPTMSERNGAVLRSAINSRSFSIKFILVNNISIGVHENAVKRIKQNGTHYPVNICIIQCLRSKYKYSYVITKLYIGKRILHPKVYLP